MNKKKVVIGMSGGVDSSVSALLLKEQGYQITGLFMKNWEETDASGTCQSTVDYQDVAKVCDLLDIPYYSINFVEEYWNLVFSQFLEELKLGHTPNPDILCNKEIKFNLLLEKGFGLGADFVATGHYAQIGEDERLFKATDLNKDQTYFLYTLKREILQKVLFPIGHLPKEKVRKIAKERGLPNFNKKDSTGICFIGKRDFKTFISKYIPYKPGNFETLDGKVVGQHDGAAYYTIGQRKGLAIGGPGEAWFVVGKSMDRNVVFVEQGQDHPALYGTELLATNLSWIHSPPQNFPYLCKAKIRYRQEDQKCTIEKIEGDQALVSFAKPQRAITSRQSIVFYSNQECLGGGLISKG
ncbi:MAG: tRNA 2-thiouridine(34) synthase MnmA [Chlamydiae bacterium]|nr:tRNA 2-thiouridine(34) synthase MnmA [Chlamydiota bacterium]